MKILDSLKKTKIWEALQGTHFWVAGLLFVISFFGGTEELATKVVMSIAGVFSAFFAVRQFIQSAKFGGWRETLVQGNTLNYLAQVLVLIGIPNIDQVIPPLKELVDAFLQGNWGLAISKGVALVTIIFYLFFSKRPAAATTLK